MDTLIFGLLLAAFVATVWANWRLGQLLLLVSLVAVLLLLRHHLTHPLKRSF